MLFRSVPCMLLLFLLTISSVSAQSLDGAPYRPGIDPDIDLLMGSWQEHESFFTHGNLEERPILTAGSPLDPPERGALLRYMKRFTRASLAPGLSTEPLSLEGEQEVYYVLGGEGLVIASRMNEPIAAGSAILVPPGVSFSLKNTGADTLTMFLVCEPVPDGFKPRRSILVKSERAIPYRVSNGHWAHIVKELIMEDDGLAVLQAFLTVTYHPMTFGQPHSHDPTYGAEEVWTAIHGTSIAFIGKQIRHQPPGTAYLIPPNGKTPHSNLNTSEEPIKLLYFAVGAGAMGSGPGMYNGPELEE